MMIKVDAEMIGLRFKKNSLIIIHRRAENDDFQIDQNVIKLFLRAHSTCTSGSVAAALKVKQRQRSTQRRAPSPFHSCSNLQSSTE